MCLSIILYIILYLWTKCVTESELEKSDLEDVCLPKPGATV